MSKDTSGAAFPARSNEQGKSFAVEELDERTGIHYTEIVHPGMTKREWLAGMVLSGLMAAETEEWRYETTSTQSQEEAAAEHAVALADALLAELNKEKS